MIYTQRDIYIVYTFITQDQSQGSCRLIMIDHCCNLSRLIKLHIIPKYDKSVTNPKDGNAIIKNVNVLFSIVAKIPNIICIYTYMQKDVYYSTTHQLSG